MLKEMGDTTFRLGSVHDNSYEEIFSSDILLNTLEESLAESAPMCSECGLISYCGTDPVYHHATQGDVVGKKPLSFFCRKNTAVIEHIFHLLDDAENRNILESWV
jgi:MoaA/NifB/PqqE/SkfB family radical SAM enzyme